MTSSLPLLLCACLLLIACTAAAPADPCDASTGGILLVPTATRPSDPDLFQPPQPPPPGGSGDCGLAGDPAAAAGPPTHFVTTAMANLSLDNDDQALAATAVGDDMLAVAWLSAGDVYVALSRGGNHFQVRRVDRGGQAALAFSSANRLHLVYEQDGRLLYRAADQGAHPADAAPIFVGEGESPQVVVDEMNWAHVIFARDGRIYKARHLSGDHWQIEFVTAGRQPQAVAFVHGQATVFGVPAGGYWFGIVMAVVRDGEVAVLRYLSWFHLWQQMAVFPLPAGEELVGPAQVDYLAAAADAAWMAAAWAAKRPSTQPAPPLYVQPVYAPLTDPAQVRSGAQAVSWHAAGAPYDAGLQQTIPLTDTSGSITVFAWGLVAADPDADVTLRLGLDPTGGGSAEGAQVVWTPPVRADVYTPFTLSAPAAGPAATIFLHATNNSAGATAVAVWDAVTIDNGAAANGDFEEPFVPQNALSVPAAWTAYDADGGAFAAGERDGYVVYGAWSEDGGRTWTPQQVVAENRSASAGLSGAIGPDAFPLLAAATVPPSVAFVYIYAAGDPPPGSSFLRYGRPHISVCTLETAVCSDPPGAPLLPRSSVRPTESLVVARDPLRPQRAVLAWDALQLDAASKDVYATYLALR